MLDSWLFVLTFCACFTPVSYSIYTHRISSLRKRVPAQTTTTKVPSSSIQAMSSTVTTTSTQTAPSSYSDLPFDIMPKYAEPLYTEIRIPLPPLPSPNHAKPATNTKPTATNASTSRARAHTLQSISPFRRRRDSGTSTDRSKSQSPPPQKSQDKQFSFSIKGKGKAKEAKSRRGTVDALAVVPAMLILKAELFTPEEKDEGTERRENVGGVK